MRIGYAALLPGFSFIKRKQLCFCFLVKGDHYFDSIIDILTKAVAEPEILEFEAGGEIREARVNESVVAENYSDQSESIVCEPKTRLGDKDSSVLEHSMESQNIEMPQVMPLDAKNQVDDPMRLTIIGTSLKHHEKLSGFGRSRHLPSDGSEKDYMDDSSIKEETLERANGPSERLIKHKSTRRAETNYHSVNSAQI